MGCSCGCAGRSGLKIHSFQVMMLLCWISCASVDPCLMPTCILLNVTILKGKEHRFLGIGSFQGWSTLCTPAYQWKVPIVYAGVPLKLRATFAFMLLMLRPLLMYICSGILICLLCWREGAKRRDEDCVLFLWEPLLTFVYMGTCRTFVNFLNGELKYDTILIWSCSWNAEWSNNGTFICWGPRLISSSKMRLILT